MLADAGLVRRGEGAPGHERRWQIEPRRLDEARRALEQILRVAGTRRSGDCGRRWSADERTLDARARVVPTKVYSPGVLATENGPASACPATAA